MKQLTISKENLKYNIKKIKSYSNKEDYTIIGIVKNNGYGLGLIEYSKILVENGINILAVATVEEALKIKQADIDADVFMLSNINSKEELEKLVNKNVIITIGSIESARIANELAKGGQSIRAHIKIDTGFGRYGFIYNDIDIIIKTISSLNENINVEGIFSHFSNSYYKDNKWTIEQFNRFKCVIDELEKNNINIKLKHICNSPAYINYPNMHLNSARIGSAFLGRVNVDTNIDLKKTTKFEVNIAEIKTVPKGFNISYANAYKTKRETKIAVIPFGYAEGFNVGPRQDMFKTINKLRNIYRDIKSLFKKQKITVAINGKQYSVIGTLGMYHAVIDITDSDVKFEDLVTIEINPLYLDRQIRREYI